MCYVLKNLCGMNKLNICSQCVEELKRLHYASGCLEETPKGFGSLRGPQNASVCFETLPAVSEALPPPSEALPSPSEGLPDLFETLLTPPEVLQALSERFLLVPIPT